MRVEKRKCGVEEVSSVQRKFDVDVDVEVQRL